MRVYVCVCDRKMKMENLSKYFNLCDKLNGVAKVLVGACVRCGETCELVVAGACRRARTREGVGSVSHVSECHCACACACVSCAFIKEIKHGKK